MSSESMAPLRCSYGLRPTVGGIPLHDLNFDKGLCDKIEKDVRYANITIIEGIKASQYGIGMICARIAEIVVRDEQAGHSDRLIP